jgi:hypothetical protein
MRDMCSGCRKFKDVAWTEEQTGRAFCEECLAQLPWTSEQRALMFLMLTIPFRPGDRVECRTAGGTPVELYDGIGTVQEISTSLEHGGTMVFPTFRVTLDEKAYPSCPDEVWYTECCLTKVGVKA